MVEAADCVGVVLAAGKGTRMHPFSERYPKPILPVGGKPVMVHQLEAMAAIGIRDVVVVIGHLGHEIIREIGDGGQYGLRIEYLEQETTLGIAHAVRQLEARVDRPFLLFLGDIYFETENLSRMLDCLGDDRETAAVLAVMRESDPEKIKRNFTVETDGADGRVIRVIEKPRCPTTDMKGCGIYLFDVSFFDAVRRTPRTAMRDEYEITDAIQIFIDRGFRVEAADVIKADLNLSFPADLLDVNLYLADQSGNRNLEAEGVVIHPSAQIDRCVLMAGVEIAEDVKLRDSLVFPGVRVGPGKEGERLILTPTVEIPCGISENSR